MCRFTGLPGHLQPDDDVGLFIAWLSWLFITRLFCRSELARENLESAAYSLITHVIVGVFREQGQDQARALSSVSISFSTLASPFSPQYKAIICLSASTL